MGHSRGSVSVPSSTLLLRWYPERSLCRILSAVPRARAAAKEKGQLLWKRDEKRKRKRALKHLLNRSRKHYAKERCQDLIQFFLHFFFSQHQSECSFNHEMMSRRQTQYAQVKTEKMAKDILLNRFLWSLCNKKTSLQTEWVNYSFKKAYGGVQG